MKWLPTKRCHGFSLLEVLVAMSFLLLLVGLLVTGVSLILHSWQQLHQEQEEVREVRAALQLLTSDLRYVVLAKGNKVRNGPFFVTSMASDSLEERFLFFLTALPKEKRASSDLGDLCAVSYFVSNEQERRTTKHHLYRFSLSHQETTKAIMQGSLLERCRLAASPNNPLCERVASDITQFQVIPIWHESEQFSTQSEEGVPALLEIVLSIGSDKKTKRSWRKIVALH